MTNNATFGGRFGATGALICFYWEYKWHNHFGNSWADFYRVNIDLMILLLGVYPREMGKN